MSKSLTGVYLFLLALILSSSAFSAEIKCQDIFGGLSQSHDSHVRQYNEIVWSNYYERHSKNTYQDQWFKQFWNYQNLFAAEKQKNSPEIALLERLGFNISGLGSVPDLKTFVKNYESYLNEKNIPENQRIHPALSFRSLDSGEIVLKTLDEAYLDTTRWVLVAPRLQSRALATALKNGKYPIFYDGLHDIFHFITFALHPEYAEDLRLGHAELLQHKLKRAMLSRAAYALEALSLGDQHKEKEIKEQLTLKDASHESTFGQFLSAVNALPKEQFDLKAKYWVEHYNEFLIHYSGGMAEPRERNVYKERIDRTGGDIDKYFSDEGRPIYGDQLPVMPDAVFEYTLAQMPTFLSKILKYSPASIKYIRGLSEEANTEAELDRVTRLHVARMEYSLWRSVTKVTASQWIHDTLVAKTNPSSPTIMFIADVYGQRSFIYRLFSDQR